MTRRLLLLALLLAHGPARAASCFDGQLPQSAWAEAAAQASVRLVTALPDGRVYANASGMVVADSGAGGHGNRIITAGHVAATLREQPGAWLAVYSSRGKYLGRALVAARAAPGPAFGLATNDGLGDANGLRFGDAAVLEMASYAPGGLAAFSAIAGLKLATDQPRGLLEGDFTAPGGVEHGVSGSGVVAEGAIVGVVVFKAVDPRVKAVAISAGDAERAWPAPRRTIRLPRHAVGYAQPLTDGSVLAGLGAAGRAVTARRGSGRLDVFVPGFVQSGCVGYHATMRPA